MSRVQKKIVIAFRTGRLANRLILFANFIALAAERGWEVSNVTFHSYAEFFTNTRRDVYCRYPIAKKRSWLEFIPGAARAIRKTRIFNHAVRFASRHPQLCLQKNSVTLRELPGDAVLNLDGAEFERLTAGVEKIFIHGWRFRAPELVERHAQTIRDYFQPPEEFENAACATTENLRRDADAVIGVHIRQGDYRHWLGGKYFYPVARYAEWMREIAAQFPNRRVAFLVCSDEPRHAEEFAGLHVAFSAASPVVDLLALSRCDFVIGTVSTFSQWASFYGAKPLLHFRSIAQSSDLSASKISDLDLVE